MQVTLLPIDSFTHIKIDRSSTTQLDSDTQQRVADAWSDLCTQNPKYFNAPIVAFDRYDPDTGVIFAYVDQYKHHAVRDSVELDLSLLAVTAIVMAEDRVLLGKRSARSHRYGGLWELGPSGGVDVPNEADRIDLASLLGEALREIREEAGFEPRVIDHQLVALVHDHLVGSSDLAVLLRIERPNQLKANWEYSDTRWMTLDELIAWVNDKPDELIPTTVVLACFLHETIG